MSRSSKSNHKNASNASCSSRHSSKRPTQSLTSKFNCFCCKEHSFNDHHDFLNVAPKEQHFDRQDSFIIEELRSLKQEEVDLLKRIESVTLKMGQKYEDAIFRLESRLETIDNTLTRNNNNNNKRFNEENQQSQQQQQETLNLNNNASKVIHDDDAIKKGKVDTAKNSSALELEENRILQLRNFVKELETASDKARFGIVEKKAYIAKSEAAVPSLLKPPQQPQATVPQATAPQQAPSQQPVQQSSDKISKLSNCLDRIEHLCDKMCDNEEVLETIDEETEMTGQQRISPLTRLKNLCNFSANIDRNNNNQQDNKKETSSYKNLDSKAELLTACNSITFSLCDLIKELNEAIAEQEDEYKLMVATDNKSPKSVDSKMSKTNTLNKEAV